VRFDISSKDRSDEAISIVTLDSASLIEPYLHRRLSAYQEQSLSNYPPPHGRENLCLYQHVDRVLAARFSLRVMRILLDERPPFMPKFVECVSHWYQHVYNIRNMLILPLPDVWSSEILVPRDCSLTGIERGWTHEGR